MYPQDYKSISIRESAILTGDYVACDIISAPDFKTNILNQLVLYVDFTKGSLTNSDIKIEFSDDGTNYYQESIEDVPTAGVTTSYPYSRRLATTGKYRFAVPIKDKYIKVSVVGNGTATGSLMAVTAIVGIA